VLEVEIMKLNFSVKTLAPAIYLLAVLSLGTPSAGAQTFFSTTLHSFTNTGGDGTNPQAGLISDASGNLFGTTSNGGANGSGTVFELVNSSGTYTEKVLYSFLGSPNDGSTPFAGLIMDASGNLFGTTSNGGANGSGTVFELVNSNGTSTEKVLYSFAASPNDGANPQAGLIRDASGNLFGTTSNGGNTLGTVFELVNSSGTYSERVLYSFQAYSIGGFPAEGLIMDASGNLFGTTPNGGANGSGTVFELVNSDGTYSEKVLHSFTDSPDGRDPQAGLIMDASGNLFGTTYFGGTGAGTVFELVNSNGTYSEKVLHSFLGWPNDGSTPFAGLIMDASGNLFGTTAGGGANFAGTVFELVNSNGTFSEKVLHHFNVGCGADGRAPSAGLIMDASGNFFGTTEVGGTNNAGTVFKITPYSAPPVATTTTLTSSPNPATAGNPATLSVTATSSLAFPPSGTVTFFNGNTQLGSVTLPCGSAALNIEDPESLGIGMSTITAQYTPDVPAFISSSGAIVQTVNEKGVVLTNGNNTLNGNQKINGSLNATNVTARSFAGNGDRLLDLNPANLTAGIARINITGNAATANFAGMATNAAGLGGIAAQNYARLDIANIFKGNQAIAGDLTIGHGTPIKEHLSMVITNPHFKKENRLTACATFPFAGASDGDTVALGVSNSREEGGAVLYFAWVSAPDTVKICHTTLSSPKTAVSGAIRVDLWKH
jgi:uncharacterized repeat protein (TIGR03803 family)